MKRLAFLIPILLLTAPVAAQKPPTSGEAMSVHPEARKAIDALKSPYCPGLMLEVCPSPGGAMLRDSIQARAERGMKADAIVEGILDEYGEEWRAEPRRSGAGLWAWIIPPAALLAGLGAVGLILAHRRRSTNGAPPPPSVGPEEEARLRQALKELDAEEEPVF